MTFKKHIPNICTLLNLLSGTIAVIYAVNNQLLIATFFVFLGIFFDFFDGFLARLLKVQGELGKQLDSLADMVTSGVVPGIVLYKLIETNSVKLGVAENISWAVHKTELLPFVGLLFTVAAGYRLAKFNIDERQTNSFIGLPTPAAALVVLSLPLILNDTSNTLIETVILSKWFLIALAVLLSYLMNAEIPLFSLKFKNYSWKNNKVKFAFIAVSIFLIAILQFVAIPLLILAYILFSVITNLVKKQV